MLLTGDWVGPVPPGQGHTQCTAAYLAHAALALYYEQQTRSMSVDVLAHRLCNFARVVKGLVLGTNG